MRVAVIGLALAVGLSLFGWGAMPGNNLAADRPYPNTADGRCELITQMTPAGDSRQLLTVIDPRTQVLSVYHVHVASGEIELKSVRSLRFDLQVEEFNGVTPLPREIRSLLEQK